MPSRGSPDSRFAASSRVTRQASSSARMATSSRRQASSSSALSPASTFATPSVWMPWSAAPDRKVSSTRRTPACRSFSASSIASHGRPTLSSWLPSAFPTPGPPIVGELNRHNACTSSLKTNHRQPLASVTNEGLGVVSMGLSSASACMFLKAYLCRDASCAASQGRQVISASSLDLPMPWCSGLAAAVSTFKTPSGPNRFRVNAMKRPGCMGRRRM
mmetsp:Transcript_10608/g.20520  ORF Transcript_10608/g.20520 Transcript_10608/m.20520 type:complete len:217 (-) Transcript_10608:194-844(-)